MARYADVSVAVSVAAHYQGAGTKYLVETPSGVIYSVYVDSGSDVAFRKSSDGGYTWGPPVIVFTGTVTGLACWYDRWSNIAAGLIHCVYQESVADDTHYRTINTESSDALSTQTTLFLGASTAGGGHLSVTRAVGGNVYCKTVIDAGAEGGFYRLPNANVPNGAWDAARTVDEAIATTDTMILLPDYDAADTQDIMAIFWDASANEISRKLHDDSANTWSETSIAGTMVEGVATTSFAHMCVAPDPANTRHILVAWSAVDAANADLRCWQIDSTTITEVTNVVLNSTDDQGMCAISLDSNDPNKLDVIYGGASGGGETYPTAINLYRKRSRDGGTTWGGEELLTKQARSVRTIYVVPYRYIQRVAPIFYRDETTTDELLINVLLHSPRAHMVLAGG